MKKFKKNSPEIFKNIILLIICILAGFLQAITPLPCKIEALHMVNFFLAMTNVPIFFLFMSFFVEFITYLSFIFFKKHVISYISNHSDMITLFSSYKFFILDNMYKFLGYNLLYIVISSCSIYYLRKAFEKKEFNLFSRIFLAHILICSFFISIENFHLLLLSTGNVSSISSRLNLFISYSSLYENFINYIKTNTSIFNTKKLGLLIKTTSNLLNKSAIYSLIFFQNLYKVLFFLLFLNRRSFFSYVFPIMESYMVMFLMSISLFVSFKFHLIFFFFISAGILVGIFFYFLVCGYVVFYKTLLTNITTFIIGIFIMHMIKTEFNLYVLTITLGILQPFYEDINDSNNNLSD
jgi:hypothetical protein